MSLSMDDFIFGTFSLSISVMSMLLILGTMSFTQSLSLSCMSLFMGLSVFATFHLVLVALCVFDYSMVSSEC